MKPQQLLSDYLNGKISGEELRTWLAKDISREARQTLAILTMDGACRDALVDFAPPLDAPERLAEKIGAVESWIQSEEETEVSQPSRNWFSNMVPAFDVVGHSKPDASSKQHKQAPARKKTRSRQRRSKRSKKRR